MSNSSGKLAPYIHTEKSAPYIYMTYLAALVPCCVCSIFYYGLRAALLILFCMVTFVLADRFCGRLSGRRVTGDYFDISSLVSGMLIALMLPPDTTLLTALAAVVFASLITKQVFGGAGSNILNSACAGRLFVELAWPTNLQGFSYREANSRLALKSLIFQQEPFKLPDISQFSLAELVAGNYPGMIGTTCLICIVAGGIFLILKGSMRLYSPVSYVLTIVTLYPVATLIADKTFTYDGMIVYLLSSGAMFVAVFLLGDLTTMPSRFASGVFAGVVCGLLTLITKTFLSPVVSLLAPVLAVNFLSFVLDFFSKTLSRRKIRSREVDVS
ncbi:MAG: RnfABCDGE type electron transport complex subunit D [Saccharofermentans sp.]|nr:RnfABCDGE type electron transport complex subunit D [Saccharofermentans sp.]